MADFAKTGGDAVSSMTTTQLTKFIQEILHREVNKKYVVVELDQLRVHEAMVLDSGCKVTDSNYQVHVFGATGEPATQNSWVQVSSQPLRLYKDSFGVVHLMGAVMNGTLATTITTLRPGFRPPFQMVCPVRAGGSTVGTVVINPDGTIVHETGSNVLFCLDNIHFKSA